jgi:hypothetical protein
MAVRHGLVSREEHELQIFQKRLLRKIFGTKEERLNKENNIS